jgi:hypothetical protein
LPNAPRRVVGRAAVIATSAALCLAFQGQSSLASAGSGGSVSTHPALGTPQLATTGTTERVRQLVQCGGTMYAVGSFTKINQGKQNFMRNNVFSFKASAPYTVTSWNPDVSGTVNSITFDGTDCSHAYIGGLFHSVHGSPATDIAEIDTATGALVSSFGHDANGEVETLRNFRGHILAGGFYTSINGSSTDKYMTSLNPTTGRDDGFIHLNISGHYQFPGARPNLTKVYNQAISYSGTLDLVMGDFTSVGGQKRQQIFMLNLATTPASVTGWTSPQWDGSKGLLSKSNPHGYPYECAVNETFYIQAAAWSPDDSTVYIGTTGLKPNGTPAGDYPRTGLCDAAAAFPSTQKPVLDKWINYTGCDSLFSAVASSTTAYFAGHERWSENPRGCNFQGPGAIAAPGIEGLSPGTGRLVYNPTRARGLGADDLVLTSAGLWVASDNYEGSAMCGGVLNHAGICFFPK